MEKSNRYRVKTTILSTVMVLLMSVILSCLFPSISDFCRDAVKEVLTERLVKDTDAEKENPEEKEFSAEILLSTDYRTATFSNISDRISTRKFSFRVPRVSLDIPVRPPENHNS